MIFRKRGHNLHGAHLQLCLKSPPSLVSWPDPTGSSIQGRRKVWKSGKATSDVVDIICLLVEIGLNLGEPWQPRHPRLRHHHAIDSCSTETMGQICLVNCIWMFIRAGNYGISGFQTNFVSWNLRANQFYTNLFTFTFFKLYFYKQSYFKTLKILNCPL